MTPEDYARLRASVQAHEGLTLVGVPDSKGSMAIGYGHNVMFSAIRKQRAEEILDDDLEDRIVGCQQALPWFDAAPGNVQRVLVEMAFQMGVDGLLGFHATLALVEQGKYAAAADQMLKSEWARIQTPARAQRLAAVMRSSDT
jgi:lysozyme